MIFFSDSNEFKIGQNYSFDDNKSQIIAQGQENKLTIGDNFKASAEISISINGNNNKILIGNDFNVQGQLIIVINGNNNNITMGNNIQVNNFLAIDMNKKCENCSIEVGNYSILSNAKLLEYGEDNELSIGENLNGKGQFTVHMNGKNNKTKLGNNIEIVTYLNLDMNEIAKNRYLEIGDNSTFYRTDIQNYDNDSSTIIGKDCMFSYNTIIYNTDGHAIFQNGKLINKAEKCLIGDHVWVGWDATIMKNSRIPDGSIIARRALVCKVFDKKNSILAGVPAKIVKENIEWSRQTINEALELEEKN